MTRNSQIDIIAHSSFLITHSPISPLAKPTRHWIASLTLAMTTPRTTPQPSRLHSLTSILAGTTRQPPRLHSLASILAGTARQPPRGSPPLKPYPSSLIVHTLSLMLYLLTLDTYQNYLLPYSCVTDTLREGFKRGFETFSENYLKFDEKFAIMLYIGVKKFWICHKPNGL
jgi:hypothetical protein